MCGSALKWNVSFGWDTSLLVFGIELAKGIDTISRGPGTLLVMLYNTQQKLRSPVHVYV